MAKGIRSFLVLILTIFIISPLYSQNTQNEPQKEFNELYQPIEVIKRLSYDNFKSIKLLHAAIMNFGGGEGEFDKLVDTYAEASALFFQNKVIESANLFTKNEKEILEVSQKVATVYKNDADKLHTEIIKMNVKYRIKKSLNGETPKSGADKAVSGASFGIQKANDLFVRSRHIESIYYFRRTKEQCFKLFDELEIPLPDEYKKDMADNKNQVFESKNKQI